MDNNLFKLLLSIEKLNDKDLKTVAAWIDFNIDKRNNDPKPVLFLNSSKVSHNTSK